MRFSLVLLNLLFFLSTGVSYAETLRGRVIELDRSATGVTIALETIDTISNKKQKTTITLSELPVDIRLNSRVVLDAKISPKTTNQGVLSYSATTARVDTTAGKGQDRTGVRSRMKRSQRSGTAGRGAQRGKN